MIPLKGFLQRAAVWSLRKSSDNSFLKIERNRFAKNLAGRLLFYRPLSRTIILLIAIVAAIAGLVAPFFQKVFVDSLSTGIPSGGHLSEALRWFHLSEITPITAISLGFISLLLSQTLGFLVRLACTREASLLQIYLSSLLYSHTLGLSAKARNDKTVGEIVNLYAQDISAAVSLVEEFMGSALGAILPLLLSPLFVAKILGLPVSTVSLVIAATMIVLLLMSWRQSLFFGSFKRLAGERMAIVNEWLQNIRIIRILDWTESFEKRIFTKRIEETENRVGMVTNGSTMNSIAQVAPLVINLIAIVVLIRMKGESTTAGDIFALLWIFGVFMARPIRNTPWMLVIFLDGITSCFRLEKFFSLKLEDEDLSKTGIPSFKSKGSYSTEAHQNALSHSAISVSGLSLELGEKHILRDISFKARPGEFIAITGDVGSGKTQFLLSLLRLGPAVFGQYLIGKQDCLSTSLDQVRSNFLFVPQDGFTMSATLRDNILFNYDSSTSLDKTINQALELADFDTVRESLRSGLDSEIGERGVNLSGGQRQRVSLARAYFQGLQATSREVVLLDDSLSAVDAATEEYLIANLICGAWKAKTRILVTHRLSVLQHADQVWELSDGKFTIIRGPA